jgi:hypothetical protein
MSDVSGDAEVEWDRLVGTVENDDGEPVLVVLERGCLELVE